MATTNSLKSRLEKIEARDKPRVMRLFHLKEAAEGFETEMDAIRASGAEIGENDIVTTVTFQMRPERRPDPVRYRMCNLDRTA